MSLSRAKGKLVARLRNRRMRDREGLVLVEGPRAVSEVLSSAAEVRFALVSSGRTGPTRDAGAPGGPRDTGSRDDHAEEEDAAGAGGDGLLHRLRDAGVAVEIVEDEVLEKLSDTESPQGVLLVCREPVVSAESLLSDPSGRILVLDGVQDPGNVGTLIRAARAFAVTGVVVLDGTADPWSPKAVRAAVGASFHVPVSRARWKEVAPLVSDDGPRLLVADATGVDVSRASNDRPWALVVGSEAHGTRPAVRGRADEVVAVSMPGGGESLNAGMAGSILLYALTRRSEASVADGGGTR